MGQVKDGTRLWGRGMEGPCGVCRAPSGKVGEAVSADGRESKRERERAQGSIESERGKTVRREGMKRGWRNRGASRGRSEHGALGSGREVWDLETVREPGAGRETTSRAEADLTGAELSAADREAGQRKKIGGVGGGGRGASMAQETAARDAHGAALKGDVVSRRARGRGMGKSQAERRHREGKSSRVERGDG